MPPGDLDLRRAEARRELRSIAEQAARAGGDVARARFRTDYVVRLKDDRSEVSEADEAAQAAIVAFIRTRRPNDAIIAEEQLGGEACEPHPRPGDDIVCWVVDPIDGTRNYVRGIPTYVCSIAAMFAGRPLAGAIYDPPRDMMYSASVGEPLLVDGAVWPADVADTRPAGLNPRLVVGLPSTPTGTVAAMVREWIGRFVGRNFGSTALHAAMVAIGALDAMLADNARLWDIAAGWVLVDAAGGKLTTPTGDPLFPMNVSDYAGQKLPALAATACAYDRLLKNG